MRISCKTGWIASGAAPAPAHRTVRFFLFLLVGLRGALKVTVTQVALPQHKGLPFKTTQCEANTRSAPAAAGSARDCAAAATFVMAGSSRSRFKTNDG